MKEQQASAQKLEADLARIHRRRWRGRLAGAAIAAAALVVLWQPLSHSLDSALANVAAAVGLLAGGYLLLRA